MLPVVVFLLSPGIVVLSGGVHDRGRHCVLVDGWLGSHRGGLHLMVEPGDHSSNFKPGDIVFTWLLSMLALLSSVATPL